jgi:hypothetical protein
MEQKSDLLSKSSLHANGEAAITAPNEPGPLEEQQEANREAEKREHKKSKPKAGKKASPSKYKAGDEGVIGPKDYDTITLPEDENDPHWDPKLKNPVPDSLIDSLADFGWDPSMKMLVTPQGDKLKIVHGRTRFRALEKANKQRKSAGLDEIVIPYLVVEEDETDIESILRNMELNTTLNYGVQKIDPMTTAESIYRLLSAGVEEKVVAKRHGITVNEMHGYVLLLDEEKCPPHVQELIRDGSVSFTAALELARRAEKMTAAQLKQAADDIAKAAQGGFKVTASQVKQAAGVQDASPATNRQKKQFILDLHSAQLAGKFGEGAKWAGIVAMEVGLGTRTIDSAWQALDRIAKGETIRVDFKQYVTDANVGKGMEGGTHESKAAPSAPVKDQKAAKKAKKK